MSVFLSTLSETSGRLWTQVLKHEWMWSKCLKICNSSPQIKEFLACNVVFSICVEVYQYLTEATIITQQKELQPHSNKTIHTSSQRLDSEHNLHRKRWAIAPVYRALRSGGGSHTCALRIIKFRCLLLPSVLYFINLFYTSALNAQQYLWF